MWRDRERVGEWRDRPLYPKLHGQLAREATTFLLQNQNQPLLSQEKPWKREKETYRERGGGITGTYSCWGRCGAPTSKLQRN